MRMINLFANVLFLFAVLPAWAGSGSLQIPKSMKYFPEDRKYSLSYQTSNYLQTIAEKNHLEFYPKPNGFSFDALMTNESLNQAILISANRRVNPEFLNKVYEHKSGQFIQVLVHDQQLSMFFFNFSHIDAQNTLENILHDLNVTRRSSLFFNFAEAQERSETAAGTAEKSPVSSSSNPNSTSYSYILGEAFKGCGIGVAEGVNGIAKYPWEALWSAGKGIKAAYNDPSAFWERSKDEFKAFSNIAMNFKEYLGKEVSGFLKKSPKEQNEILCNYLGTGGVVSAASKAVKVAGLTSKASALREPVPPRFANHLEEIDRNISENFFAVELGTAAEAAVENEKVLSSLRNTMIAPTKNPKRLAGLTKEQIDVLYQKVESNPVAAICKVKKYEGKNPGIGFCFGRATAAHIEALYSGLQKDKIRKIWATGDLDANGTKWGWHVATVVQDTKGVWWAIDPIFGEAVTADQWYERMKKFDAGGNMRLFTTEAKRFGPSESSKYDPYSLEDDFYNGYFEDLMYNFKQDSKELVKKAKSKAPKK